jgi:hypothetical protein
MDNGRFTSEEKTMADPRDDIPLAPIAGWSCSLIPSMGAVMLRLSYLTHPLQKVEEANESPHFVLTPKQAQELSELLQRSLQALARGPAEGSGLPKH